MALSWNEIRDRAFRFSKAWQGESRERAEKDTFWNEFFEVFGKTRRSLAVYEQSVKKLGKRQGFIDLFWKGTLLVEHKSKGENLDAAFEQATDYFHGIKEVDLPRFVLVSDFGRFRLFDLDAKTEHEFALEDFPKHIQHFGFIAGYKKHEYKEQDPVNIKAAELMGKLHDQLEESGYDGHELEILLVRLLFCLFAEDTTLFEQDLFREFLEEKTREDGSDTGSVLTHLFQILNKDQDKRPKTLDDHLQAFPYVNGNLFAEQLSIPSFTSKMREILLECSSLDWGKISPAIFGSMFQSVMNPEERRNLGAHYTSESNILKVIEPLFLGDLKAEFERVKGKRKQLEEFHAKLGTLTFLDPACGCGNFLIITYRELRKLELEVIKTLLYKHEKLSEGAARDADMKIDLLVKVNVDQFYGIEYDEFPSRIAEVALWLIDHQMNMAVSEVFGKTYGRLPLRAAAKITQGDALAIDWETLIPKARLSYILGNPPFIGSKIMKAHQRAAIGKLFSGSAGSGNLDYVSGWYIKAAEFIQGTPIKVGFVSTNSIVQGEQTSVLWGRMLDKYKVTIHFAHRTFKWSNEAKGKAAVFCVIIGFASFDTSPKWLFDYEDIKGDAHKREARNINPYLIDAENVLIGSRSNPICNVSKMSFGNMPLDGGNLLLSNDEKTQFVETEPNALKYIRPLISAKEFLNGGLRWCIWLVGAEPSELRSLPETMKRIMLIGNFASSF
jgi:type II restriction/modification system DNA methylase subunit YeeA